MRNPFKLFPLSDSMIVKGVRGQQRAAKWTIKPTAGGSEPMFRVTKCQNLIRLITTGKCTYFRIKK